MVSVNVAKHASQSRNWRSMAVLLGATLLLVPFAGCSGTDAPPVGEVTGTVTLDAKPLADATVMFQPTQAGRPSTGKTDQEGRYTLDYVDGVTGAILGSHKVIIRTEIPGEDGQPPIAKEKLPRRYHDNTELTAEVKEGSNTFDFSLTSGAGAGAKK